MDHLPLPVDKFTRSPITIPYVCNAQYSYDDNGFLTYPHRCRVDVWELCEREQIHKEEWTPFLQAWLWFGLLGETIGIGARAHIPQRITSFASFIQEEEDGTRSVVTNDLQKSILAASKKNQGPLFNEFHRSRFDACLVHANQTLEKILSTQSCKTFIAAKHRWGEMPPLYHILLSVQALTETLHASRSILFSTQPLCIIQPVRDLQPSPQLVDLILRDSGWCPFDIPRLPKDIRVRHYLSYVAPFDIRGHGYCDKDKCMWGTFDDNDIHPRHTTEGCACLSIAISDDQLTGIVNEGDIALLTFPENHGGKRSVEVVRFRVNGTEPGQTPPYVAVSHVRFAGLGNGNEYSLPYCQLSSLQIISNTLLGSIDTCVPFWIDTMCLPREHASKKRALRDIPRIYASASKVIVLDPSLFRHSTGSVQDAMFRIRYSLWKKRLWTLQEGLQPKYLYLRFENQTIRLDELNEHYERSPYPILKASKASQLVNYDILKYGLACFDCDIKTVGVTGDQKKQLHSILRLGYLACPLYRFLCEDEEANGSVVAARALVRVYSSQAPRSDSTSPNLEVDQLDAAKKRLQDMQMHLQGTL